MKNLVDEWSKKWGYTVKDTTKDQGNAPVEWTLEVNNGRYSVLVITEKNFQDLLRFQTLINFSPEHQQITANLKDGDYNAFVLDMTDRLANLGSGWIFNHDTQNSKQINSLVMTYFVVYDNVDKNTILHILNKAFINIAQMLRAISITLNRNADPRTTSIQTDAKDKPMYL